MSSENTVDVADVGGENVEGGTRPRVPNGEALNARLQLGFSPGGGGSC